MEKASFLIGHRIRIRKNNDEKQLTVLNVLYEPHDYLVYHVISKIVEKDMIIYQVAANNIPQNFLLISINGRMYFEPQLDSSFEPVEQYPVEVVLD